MDPTSPTSPKRLSAIELEEEEQALLRAEEEAEAAREQEISERARRRWALTRQRLIVDRKGTYSMVVVSLQKSGTGRIGDLSDDFGLLSKLKKMGGDGPGLLVVEELDKALIGAYNEKLPAGSGKRIKEYSMLTDVNGRTTAESMLTELLVANKATMKFSVPTPKSLSDAYFLTRSKGPAENTEEAKAKAMAKSINDMNIDEHVTHALTRAATVPFQKRRNSFTTDLSLSKPNKDDKDGVTNATTEEAGAADEEEEEKAKLELAALMVDPTNVLLLQEVFAARTASSISDLHGSTMGSMLGDIQTQAQQEKRDSKRESGGWFSNLFCCGSQAGKEGPPLEVKALPVAP